MREIEVKMRVKNFDETLAKLEAAGCVLGPEIHQHDTCYCFPKDKDNYNSHKNVLGIRVRRQDKGSTFTVKRSLTTELDCLEHETEISDPDAMERALLELGLIKLLEVKKTRRKGKLAPSDDGRGEYELCLDRVEVLGDFIELEKMCPDETDAALVLEELLAKLETLGISRDSQEPLGYDTQIFKLTHEKR